MVVKEYHLYPDYQLALYERATDKGPKEGETQEDNRGIKESWYPLTD